LRGNARFDGEGLVLLGLLAALPALFAANDFRSKHGSLLSKVCCKIKTA